MKSDLDLVIEKASIELHDSSDKLLLKSTFKIFNKINIGLLLWMGLMLFFMVFVLRSNNWFLLLFLLIPALFIFILSLVSFLSKLTDYVIVTNEEICFRHNLKKRKFRLNQSMKIIMKTKKTYTKSMSSPFSGSYFRHVELFLKIKEQEFEIFHLMVDERFGKQANNLGSEITRLIKKRINDCTIQNVE